MLLEVIWKLSAILKSEQNTILHQSFSSSMKYELAFKDYFKPEGVTTGYILPIGYSVLLPWIQTSLS